MIEQTIKTLKLSQLDDDIRNSNRCDTKTLEKLKNNIAASGYYPPLIVRPHPEQDERYIVIDGHHRKKVLEDLGHTDVLVQVLQVSEEETMKLLLTLNRLRGEDNPYKRAELISELSEYFDHDDLTNFIPESEGEIQELLKLLDLEEDEMNQELDRILKEETEGLPVILNFVVSVDEKTLIQSVLNAFQPEGDKNPSTGLIKLCENHLSNAKLKDESDEREKTA